jgi:hypothetical protein
MKVKIVKAVSSNWYFGKIGEEFEVVSEDAFIYSVKRGDDIENYGIFKSDCEILIENNITDPVKIPFTFEAWDKDRTQKVWTRDGREVKDLTYLPSMRLYKVVGVVKNDVCNEYEMISFTEEGLYSAGEESKFDLFLEHHEREYWVNVYEGEAGIFLGSIFKSEKEVNCTSCPGYKLIKTIKF